MSTKGKKPATVTLDANSQKLVDESISKALLAYQAGAGGNADQTSANTTVTKLNAVSARALMEQAKEAAGYTGKFSDADVKEFMNKFNAEQAKNIEKIITISKSRVSAGAGADAITNTVNSVAREEFPSFFKPADFASDYIWNKVNFKDSATLSGKNLGILNQVRSVVNEFNVLGFSDSETLAAAKDIAKGKSTIADLTVKLQQVAIKEYPTLADRFKADPTLTTRGAATPVINMLAKTWEMDPESIKLDDPIVLSWLHPGGADGKTPAPSYADLYSKAMNDTKREYTTAAHEAARSAATSMGRAFGFGV